MVRCCKILQLARQWTTKYWDRGFFTTTEDGSYYLNGATQTNQTPLTNLTRKRNATWVLPSENEWYKATYYDPNKNGQGPWRILDLCNNERHIA